MGSKQDILINLPLSNKKISIILENIGKTGGISQAFKLFNQLKHDGANPLICIIFENKNLFSELLKISKAIVKFFYYQRSLKSFRVVKKKLTPSKSHLVISTSKKTLDFVEDLESKHHIHYFQHLEIWDFYNTKEFINFCKTKGYPSSRQLVNLYKKSKKYEFKYIETLSKIRNFYTVSNFLSDILRLINKNPNVEIKEVSPHILPFENINLHKKYVLFFIRNIPFKGDDIVLKLIKKLYIKFPILIVVSGNVDKKIIAFLKMHNIKYHLKPTDKYLSHLFNLSKVVVHSSLVEGFGSIPQEALNFSCNVVCSNTGWLINTDRNKIKSLSIISKHIEQDYLNEITKQFNN